MITTITIKAILTRLAAILKPVLFIQIFNNDILLVEIPKNAA
jgi:hypothetical protein